jgi:hypothetical protein
MSYTNFSQDYKMPQLRTASRPALANNSAGGFFIRRRVASPGTSQSKGAAKPLARRVRTPVARAKPKRRSPLPNWYPRVPLRDITSIVKVVTYFPRLYLDVP